MKALRKRHIRPGYQFDKIIPRSIEKDSVIRPEGKARLHHTINLIKQLVPETKSDTKLLASHLKGSDLESTCKNIWDFVYYHIQYARDKTGVEQVRRPSRAWADRKKGVDCDCYSVFISSILTNLNIPHKLRITKYGGKQHYQHIYPIVPNGGAHITMDCVTDQFDYEVPFSGFRDFDIDDTTPVGEINGLEGICGVDSFDLLIDGLGSPRTRRGVLPLRHVTAESMPKQKPVVAIQPESTQALIPSKTSSPRAIKVNARPQPATEVVQIKAFETPIITTTKKIKTGLAGKILLAFGVGLGAYKLTQILT
ncbi:MAG: hypothetical protein AAF620_11735 [Bacteroidota bacterium]